MGDFHLQILYVWKKIFKQAKILGRRGRGQFPPIPKRRWSVKMLYILLSDLSSNRSTSKHSSGAWGLWCLCRYHSRKYAVFHQMLRHQRLYQQTMDETTPLTESTNFNDVSANS